MIPDFLKEFEEYEDFRIWNFGYVDDDYGSQKSQWTPGAQFSATLVLDDSVEMNVAQSQGVTGVWRVVTDRSVYLPWHTVFRSLDNERTFRVTSRKPISSPSNAGVDIRYVRAEDYELTDKPPTEGDPDDGE